MATMAIEATGRHASTVGAAHTDVGACNAGRDNSAKARAAVEALDWPECTSCAAPGVELVLLEEAGDTFAATGVEGGSTVMEVTEQGLSAETVC